MSELLQFSGKDSNETLEEILASSKKAAELDPKNPEAPVNTGAYYFFKGNFEQARQYFKRAVDLNPSYPDAYHALGHALAHAGQYAESEEHFQQAIDLNPLDPNVAEYRSGLYFSKLGVGDYEAAHGSIEQCLAQFPNRGLYRGFKAAVMGYLDKGEEAKQALDDYLVLRPNLKTREDYKKIFVPNSALADILIEGLIKAGWEPEGG